MLHRIRAFCIALFLSVSPALASDWTVVKVSGAAWIAGPNAPAVRAAKGMIVPDGATFSTSHNARAKLERGAETIMVSPNTTLSPRQSAFFGATTIQQRTGRAEYEVEKRNVRHFSVETPFLAAVVKGTRFTVSVSPRAADVQVDRGLVEVSNPRSGAVAEVAAGQSAKVDSSNDRGLSIKGVARDRKAQPRPEILRASRQDAVKTGQPGSKSSLGKGAGSSNAGGSESSSGNAKSGDRSGGSGKSKGSPDGKGKSNSGGKSPGGPNGKGNSSKGGEAAGGGKGGSGGGRNGGGDGGSSADGKGGSNSGNGAGSGGGSQGQGGGTAGSDKGKGPDGKGGGNASGKGGRGRR